MYRDVSIGTLFLLFGLMLKELGLWILRRVDYWFTIFVFCTSIYTVWGVFWSDSFAPPYASLFVIGGILLIIAAIVHWEMEKKRKGHLDYKYEGLKRDPWLVKMFAGTDKVHDYHRIIYHRIFYRSIWTVTILHLLVSLSAFSYCDDSGGKIHWTVSNRDGVTLQETSYPLWAFGYNATDRTEVAAFQWSGTYKKDVRIDSENICEIEITYDYACERTHDNVVTISTSSDMGIAINETFLNAYIPAVVADARKLQGTCTLNEWRTVQSTFMPTKINPRISSWWKAETKCRYHFVSKI